ncbi:MAG: hypothetical protein HY286_19390 [Planctomycetes bacterium]|nr:hypothetical protein [Planctomycetota bacterium]
MRKLLIIIFISAGLIFIIIGLTGAFQSDGRAAPNGMAGVSSAQCMRCHADIYEEWKDSFHAGAYADPEVRKLSNDYTNEQCIDCHAPRPVLETGIDKPPLPRSARRAEGVDCLACHGDGGSIATLSKTAAGACGPRFDARLGDERACGTCHDQHFTVQEWKQTPFAKDGIGCIACHIPARDREGGAKGKNHSMPASHDERELRKVLQVKLEPFATGVKIIIKNVGAGHHFPTDERSRAADLILRWKDANGAIIKIEKVDRYRNPYRDETGASDGLPYREESPLLERRPASTLLPYGVERTYNLTRPDRAAAADFIIIYKTIPYPTDAEKILADDASFKDKKAFIIFEQTIRF